MNGYGTYAPMSYHTSDGERPRYLRLTVPIHLEAPTDPFKTPTALSKRP